MKSTESFGISPTQIPIILGNFEQVNQLVRDDDRIKRVSETMGALGFNVDRVRGNGAFLDISGTSRQAQSALGMSLGVYAHPNAEVNIVRAEQYVIPELIKHDVQGIPHIAHFFDPSRKVGVKAHFSENDGSSTNVGIVTLKLLNSYYGIDDNVVQNSNATQAVFESLGQMFNNNDLFIFQDRNNLKEQDVSKIIGKNVYSACYTSNPKAACGESHLDVQYIMGIAQNSPTSYYSVPYNSSDPLDDIFFRYLEILADEENPPLVHSLSYTIEESIYTHIQMFEMELKKLSLKGLTFLVSSGDYGAVSPIVNIGGTSKCGYYVEYPASSPLMTSIGATQGPEVSQEEIACSVRNGAAITSGGGFSNVAQTPDYQKNAVENYFKVANPQPKPGFNRSGRGVPDLSLLGVNYQVVLFGSNESISGKSASTPVFAGMVTLINDCRLQKGKGPIGFLNQILYSLDSSYFVDITKGDNQCGEDLSLCCNEGFFASPGWDPVTGLGSPKFKLLKDKLCNL